MELLDKHEPRKYKMILKSNRPLINKASLKQLQQFKEQLIKLIRQVST